MAMVTFGWEKWRIPTLTDAELEKIKRLGNENNNTNLIKLFVPYNRGLLGLLAFVALVIIPFFTFIKLGSSDLETVIQTIGATLVAWSVIQAPLYYLSIQATRRKARKWLEAIQKNYQSVRAIFSISNSQGSNVIYDMHVNIQIFNDFPTRLKDQLKEKVHPDEYAKFQSLILINSIKNPIAYNLQTFSLAHLTHLINPNPKNLDVYKFDIQVSGEISAQMYEPIVGEKKLLGFL